MFKRCKHKWTEIDRFFQPPHKREIKVTGWDTNAISRIYDEATIGFTTVELRCQNCKKPNFVEVRGDARITKNRKGV